MVHQKLTNHSRQTLGVWNSGPQLPWTFPTLQPPANNVSLFSCFLFLFQKLHLLINNNNTRQKRECLKKCQIRKRGKRPTSLAAFLSINLLGFFCIPFSFIKFSCLCFSWAHYLSLKYHTYLLSVLETHEEVSAQTDSVTVTEISQPKAENAPSAGRGKIAALAGQLQFGARGPLGGSMGAGGRGGGSAGSSRIADLQKQLAAAPSSESTADKALPNAGAPPKGFLIPSYLHAPPCIDKAVVE